MQNELLRLTVQYYIPSNFTKSLKRNVRTWKC